MNTNRKKATPLFVIGGFCLILFITIASAIATESNWVARFDLNWIGKIRDGIQPDKTSIVKLVTNLGSAETTIILTIIVVLILFFLRKFVVGLWFGGTMLVCGVVLNLALKSLVGRHRPDSVNWLISESGFSFPSGHATATAVFYGLAGLFLIFTVPKIWQKIVIGIITYGFILFVMYTRVYLGVHFPTDVLGGFFLGTASVCISLGVYFIARKPLHNLLVKWRIKDRSIIE
ncbi:phosphatase PAP2 family protein [Listeria seeligeri]|uniref:phosphatase PAP2 family protein n=1 Tax=Listeria seeligeri TaxID=1640 RepID=UPI001625D546|nr:phosphatase PAP2 family protein [Listeria seeligeri]MBC1585047.1 phosphatase PAP2 family protein [Listeria seeligeri]MBM5597203.1 phosphatase PAP2 family protein [Listeria seeligeri]